MIYTHERLWYTTCYKLCSDFRTIEPKGDISSTADSRSMSGQVFYCMLVSTSCLFLTYGGSLPYATDAASPGSIIKYSLLPKRPISYQEGQLISDFDAAASTRKSAAIPGQLSQSGRPRPGDQHICNFCAYEFSIWVLFLTDIKMYDGLARTIQMSAIFVLHPLSSFLRRVCFVWEHCSQN